MTTTKMGLQVLLDENDKPIAILFRTKEGHWVWHKVEPFDESGNVDLVEGINTKICKNASSNETKDK